MEPGILFLMQTGRAREARVAAYNWFQRIGFSDFTAAVAEANRRFRFNGDINLQQRQDFANEYDEARRQIYAFMDELNAGSVTPDMINRIEAFYRANDFNAMRVQFMRANDEMVDVPLGDMSNSLIFQPGDNEVEQPVREDNKENLDPMQMDSDDSFNQARAMDVDPPARKYQPLGRPLDLRR
jgi:hypothetical protein